MQVMVHQEKKTLDISHKQRMNRGRSDFPVLRLP